MCEPGRDDTVAGMLSSLSALTLLSTTPLATQDLTGLELPDGLEARLWAESPRLYNPTAMDVDARGRIFVTEAVNYRKWGGRNPGRVHEPGDRVVILEDTDGDGVCDASKVYVQEEELVAPLGVCVVGNQVYVSCSPNILRYTDHDGDDVPDEREVFLTGFGGFDHDHGVHSLVLGAGGWLYGAAGNAGPHLVSDAGGWRLRSGSLYNGGGPSASDNKPGLVSDDGRTWIGGVVFRVRQDGTGLEVLAHNFRNQYEVALDAYGNLYTADNDDDGNQSCRTVWALEGGNYGYVSEDGARSWRADRRPGQGTQDAHWHRSDPGVMPNGTINGAGGPTGVAVYEGRLLADWIDGAVLNCDAGAGVVYAHRPAVEGGGIVLAPGELIRGVGEEESGRWFRPSDVVVGVDGAVYVSDWYDPGVGGHRAGDEEAYGRILCITPSGGAPVSAEARGADSPAVGVRNQALLELDGAELAVRCSSEDPRTRARALRRVGADAAVFAREEDELVRAAILRSMGQELVSAAPEIVEAETTSAFLRTLLFARLAREELQLPLETLAELASQADLDLLTRMELEAYGLLAAGREPELWPLLVERGSAGLEALAWRLHPEVAMPVLVRAAADAGRSLESRRRAIDAIAFVPTPLAASAMHMLALNGADDTRAYATHWARHRAGNLWRAYELPLELQERGYGNAERIWQSPLVRKGMVEVDVDIEGCEVIWLIVHDGGNGNSCDWADWIEPRFVTEEGELPLTREPWLEARAQWGNVAVDANAGGGKLRVGGEDYSGIGTHANSRIGYAVPAGAKRFRARCAVDDGGTSQSGGQATSVGFELHVERSQARERIAKWIELLRHEGADEAEREEALRALALDPRGGMWLVHQAQKEMLPPAVLDAAGEHVFANPDLSVRALASEHFRRPGAEAALPPVSELVSLVGDPARGREVFFDERAQCSTCHAVVRGEHRRGGDIGPELSALREKYGAAEILDAILNPSAAIAFGYDTWLLEDTEGELYSGFLLADGDTIILKDTQGRRHTFDREDVVERYKQSLSTMPQGVALGISPQEIADVVAFLGERPDGSWLAQEEVSLFDGKSLEGWTFHLNDPGTRMEEVWSVRDGVLVCEGRPIGYLRTEAEYTNYVLELEWRFDPERGAGNSGVLLRVLGEDKVWPKSIEAQLHHGNAGDIWNIERFEMETDAHRRNGRRTSRREPSSERPLGEWNRYRIVMAGERLLLEVNGVLQNEARWCEEVAGTIALQSEGAPIEFRNIRLRPLVRVEVPRSSEASAPASPSRAGRPGK